MTSSSSLSEQKFSVLASKYIKSVEILFRIDSVSLCCLSVSEHVSCCFPDVEVYSNLHHVFVLKCFFLANSVMTYFTRAQYSLKCNLDRNGDLAYSALISYALFCKQIIVLYSNLLSSYSNMAFLLRVPRLG